MFYIARISLYCMLLIRFPKNAQDFLFFENVPFFYRHAKLRLKRPDITRTACTYEDCLNIELSFYPQIVPNRWWRVAKYDRFKNAFSPFFLSLYYFADEKKYWPRQNANIIKTQNILERPFGQYNSIRDP